ncbi:xanthine dehydrogenase family protein molybdopterin-binding subunit [Echinicola vietnamensis]|uniref:Aerobic-type carbon monoxide dehydrogenase, large subunit CoxL/CutL-like protein n=1 Tax=Echinicola vietnamensis (strain DSM 17526 / LMG 23754 / KMM 6221) TaxID=926556 RepID=L0G4W1_ECHVK|nr:molybdopterin cofactor-binding domain-containing protein [Echinicola vietnamensis]AGA80363.1 aerobic-type carbon monoxide dehydrogenase, large subunit CoxL/CutL-like protein [Echinicola vietnamensis DSM 17526]
MKTASTKINRRSFLKVTSLTGGGMLLSLNWLAACKPSQDESLGMPKEWFQFNGFIKIGENGKVTIMSPNPEGGQNVKTSMPMIVAEELDVDWKNVIVEQADLDTKYFTRQFIGGSQAIRSGYTSLRTAGATARAMLVAAAAKSWNVPADGITVKSSTIYHKASDKSANFGEFASLAATMPVPEEVQLKANNNFTIIGSSKKNVEAKNIVTGKPLFGIDTQCEGMLIAMIIHPPAFGKQLKSFDDSKARKMPGIKDVFRIKPLQDDYKRTFFDTVQFTDLIAIVGNSTWEVLQAKKVIQTEWEIQEAYEEKRDMFGREGTRVVPRGLESTTSQEQAMKKAAKTPRVQRKDGDPETAFKNASKTIERTYTGPFLSHNCMEPMNFFAHVQEDKVICSGPLQKPELTEKALSSRLGIPLENIEIAMTRLGGGYGRRSYAHWLIEAAVISKKVNAPIKLIYTREDDMTGGIYRSRYQATYRAALDENNQLVAFHVNAGGLPENPLYPNRFPAGAVDNYLAEGWDVPSNITTGSFRAPRSNFMACVEQSFLDEVAELAGKDPIDFRLELLEKSKNNPVGERNDYDPDRYAKVLQLVKDKADWSNPTPGISRGVSAYFCHNSYAAQVLDLKLVNGQVQIDKVTNAIDCGIVINPDAAKNLCEGAVVDGIGTAMFGELTFENGVVSKSNFDGYKQIRMGDAPKTIETYFVENGNDPSGLGEPAYPPVFAALANALYQATGNRFYHQPFVHQLNS